MGLERFTTGATTGASRRDVDLPSPVARAFAPREGGPEEVCHLCASPLPDEHRHLVEVVERNLVCACRGCALLFEQHGGRGGRGGGLDSGNGRSVGDRSDGGSGRSAGGDVRYRTVPERYRQFDQFRLRLDQWAALRIPVDLAFVMWDSHQDRPVALYPSPAGATESELALTSWGEMVAANPVLADLAPDVEAVLMRVAADGQPDGGDGRTAEGHGQRVAGNVPETGMVEAWIVPVDRCYELVGHLRLNWRGFGGGAEVRDGIDEFFAEVRARAKVAARGEASAGTGDGDAGVGTGVGGDTLLGGGTRTEADVAEMADVAGRAS